MYKYEQNVNPFEKYIYKVMIKCDKCAFSEEYTFDVPIENYENCVGICYNCGSKTMSIINEDKNNIQEKAA